MRNLKLSAKAAFLRIVQTATGNGPHKIAMSIEGHEDQVVTVWPRSLKALVQDLEANATISFRAEPNAWFKKDDHGNKVMDDNGNPVINVSLQLTYIPSSGSGDLASLLKLEQPPETLADLVGAAD